MRLIGTIAIVIVIIIAIVIAIKAMNGSSAKDIGREAGQAIDNVAEEVSDVAEDAVDALDRKL